MFQTRRSSKSKDSKLLISPYSKKQRQRIQIDKKDIFIDFQSISVKLEIKRN